MKLIIIIVIAILLPGSCFAQINKDSIDLVDFLGNDSVGPKTISTTSVDDSSFRIAILDYNVFALKHRVNAYKWQLLSSKIIFFVSIFIVLVGLYLSYLQFQLSKSGSERKNKKLTKRGDVSKGESENIEVQTVTSFQLGKEGIKVDSAVIGLIILIVSIVFFFLYLKFAFHINDFG